MRRRTKMRHQPRPIDLTSAIYIPASAVRIGLDRRHETLVPGPAPSVRGR
jgi:hypothetical protein